MATFASSATDARACASAGGVEGSGPRTGFQPPPVPPAVKGLAGSFGGMMEACFLQPIDVIKTRLQLDTTGKYKGIYHCGSSIAKEEGMRSLWKGLTPFATHLTLKYALRMVRS
jgi:solute carrier family 25 (mitochondrial citrate transporter), member 1